VKGEWHGWIHGQARSHRRAASRAQQRFSPTTWRGRDGRARPTPSCLPLSPASRRRYAATEGRAPSSWTCPRMTSWSCGRSCLLPLSARSGPTVTLVLARSQVIRRRSCHIGRHDERVGTRRHSAGSPQQIPASAGDHLQSGRVGADRPALASTPAHRTARGTGRPANATASGPRDIPPLTPFP
jgi:hypothetical protein